MEADSMNSEVLRSFLGEVAKLYSLTSAFIKSYDTVNSYSGRYVHEVPDDIRLMVLGGLKADGDYVENAYGLFAKDILGVYLEDPRLYVAKLKLGEKPDVKIATLETLFTEFVLKLNSVLAFLINEAKDKLNINVSSRGVGSKLGLEDLVKKIIEESVKFTVGVNEFVSKVWSLRKITPHYLKKAYPELHEQRDLLEVLGFTKLLTLRNYELWGFPDYFTKCTLHDTSDVGGGAPLIVVNGIPIVSYLVIIRKYLDKYPLETVAPKTIGGAICMLNEVIWRYMDLLKDTLSKWFEGYTNVEEYYIKEAWKSLGSIGWSIPKYLEDEKAYAKLSELLEGIVGSSRGSPFKFLVYDDGIVGKCICWVYRGNYASSGFVEYKLSRYITVPELIDDLMPAIFLGVFDTTLQLNGRNALLIIVRR